MASTILWLALCIWCPQSRQVDFFHQRGAELFSDFAMPRTCAQAADPYAAEAVGAHDRCYAMIAFVLAGAFPADTYTGGLLFTMTGALLFVLSLGILIDSCRDGEWWMIPALALSSPFIWNLERANQIWIAVSGVMLFLAWHESDSRGKRLAALLALALASALKVSPGVFSLLLLKERRWRDFLVFLLAGAILTFLPFVLWGDIGMVGEWLAGMRAHDDCYHWSKSWGTARLIWPSLRFFGLPVAMYSTICEIGQRADWVLAGIATCCFFKSSTRGAEAFLLAVCAMIVPNSCQPYTLFYLLPALALVGKGRLPLGEAVLWLMLLSPLRLNFWRDPILYFMMNCFFLPLVGWRLVKCLREWKT